MNQIHTPALLSLIIHSLILGVGVHVSLILGVGVHVSLILGVGVHVSLTQRALSVDVSVSGRHTQVGLIMTKG